MNKNVRVVLVVIFAIGLMVLFTAIMVAAQHKNAELDKNQKEIENICVAHNATFLGFVKGQDPYIFNCLDSEGNIKVYGHQYNWSSNK